ncbi:MAG TPA: hypothetical protein PK881_03935 [Leptospiraceae bacterium]|nr:hypothetical protein [Leptospiraceae bacterium]
MLKWVSFVLLSCFSIGLFETHALHSQAQESAQDAANRIAATILSGTNEEQSRAAIREAFAWAGMSTRNSGTVVLGARLPDMPIYLDESEIEILLADAKGRKDGLFRMTLAELGESVNAPESVFPTDPPIPPGTVFRLSILMAVRAARQDPNNVHSFVPLFLDAMAQRSYRGRDITNSRIPGNQFGLSLLEVQLLLSALMRTARPTQSYPVERDLPGQRGQNVCSDLLDRTGDFNTPLRIAIRSAADVPFQSFFKFVGDNSDPAAGAFLRNSSSVLKYAKMTGLMDKVMGVKYDFALNPIPAEQHYNVGSQTNVRASFKASVTLNQRLTNRDNAALDCARLLGITVPDTTEAMRRAAGGFRVYWFGVAGFPTYAEIMDGESRFNYHAPLGSDLTLSGNTAFATMIVRPATESQQAHNAGLQKRESVSVVAQLDKSDANLIQNLINAVRSGVGPQLAIDPAVNLMKKLFGQKREATLTVTHHQPFRLAGTIRGKFAFPRQGAGPAHELKGSEELEVFFRENGTVAASYKLDWSYADMRCKNRTSNYIWTVKDSGKQNLAISDFQVQVDEGGNYTIRFPLNEFFQDIGPWHPLDPMCKPGPLDYANLRGFGSPDQLITLRGTIPEGSRTMSGNLTQTDAEFLNIGFSNGSSSVRAPTGARTLQWNLRITDAP